MQNLQVKWGASSLKFQGFLAAVYNTAVISLDLKQEVNRTNILAFTNLRSYPPSLPTSHRGEGGSFFSLFTADSRVAILSRSTEKRTPDHRLCRY